MSILVESSEKPIPVTVISQDNAEGSLKSLTPAASTLARVSGFKGEAGKIIIVPGDDGEISEVLFGLGSADDFFALSPLSLGLPAGDYQLQAAPWTDAECALALLLGAYAFNSYKTGTKENGQAQFIFSPSPEIKEAEHLARAVNHTRDFVNIPSSDMGPEELAGAARAIAERYGATVTEIIGEELLAQGHEMIHAVGRASTRTPRLIDMTWGPEEAPKVTLVGKGVCFDSGGLDIKPASSMLLMKKDMGGAANVLGLAEMIMSNQLNLRLRVLIPAVENAISGNAFRPGDVLKSYKGMTVEIENTDAEGRLVLADALALADEEAPDLLIDMATLTGAARVAMGPEVVPFYSEDSQFVAEVCAAGATTSDPVWQLPLWQPYAEGLASRVADVMHTSPGGFGGSITAALFLQKFVENAKTWAHFDIYAWNPKERPGRPIGGEAMAIRALYQVIKARYAN
ncbi:MAG: leucyl aminopeptidase family protein [Alphaproteobacteria bacterium]|nr:MAG: leucyl aminopeptidase family protein [Alphaproteobacteria bacterium]